MTNPDDAHAPTHEEHTGHGGHHVLSRRDLLRTIGLLAGLTVLTVVLALMERAGWLPLGPLSVPVALLIAGVKATLVAMFFMGLKYDNRTNALTFVGGIVFLIVFLSFTFLDTLFRDTFDGRGAETVDVVEARSAEALVRDSLVRQAINPATLVSPPDTLLLPGAPTTPSAVPAPAATPGEGAAPAAEPAPEPAAE